MRQKWLGALMALAFVFTLFLPRPLLLSVSEHAPFTPAFAFLAAPRGKSAIDCWYVTIAAQLTLMH